MSQSSEPGVNILNSIKGTELDVHVVLMEKEYQIGDLLRVNPGTVLIFDKKEEEPVFVQVNGKCFAKGEVVQVGEHYGLKVQELLGDPEIE